MNRLKCLIFKNLAALLILTAVGLTSVFAQITTMSYSSKEADEIGISRMKNSGTWGREIDLLIPLMTPAGVETVVSIYLERQLFPGISRPENAQRVAATIDTALGYMTEEARKVALDNISVYYNSDNVPASSPKVVNNSAHRITTEEEADKRGIAIMTNSGTWGREIDLLIPLMTPAAVETVVSIYLERQLFPGISRPENARRVAATINTALGHMSEDAQKVALDRISAFL